jgi:hypothetical protein
MEKQITPLVQQQDDTNTVNIYFWSFYSCFQTRCDINERDI